MSKNLKPCTSSTMVIAPAIDLAHLAGQLEADVEHLGADVEQQVTGRRGAWWRAPRNSTNGCNSAGRGPENNRSQASDPIEVTIDRFWTDPEPDRPDQTGQAGQRLVDRGFAALIDGGDQEDRRRCQRSQYRLR